MGRVWRWRWRRRWVGERGSTIITITVKGEKAGARANIHPNTVPSRPTDFRAVSCRVVSNLLKLHRDSAGDEARRARKTRTHARLLAPGHTHSSQPCTCAASLTPPILVSSSSSSSSSSLPPAPPPPPTSPSSSSSWWWSHPAGPSSARFVFAGPRV